MISAYCRFGGGDSEYSGEYPLAAPRPELSHSSNNELVSPTQNQPPSTSPFILHVPIANDVEIMQGTINQYHDTEGTVQCNTQAPVSSTLTGLVY